MAACLAYEIRRHREQHGLSQERLGKELFTSRATIQAYGTLDRRPGVAFARQLDEFFGTDLHFRALWHHARREHIADWLQRYISYEAKSRQIKVFQPFVIPGLFQTERYARAVEAAGRTRNIDAVIETRLARQSILTRTDPQAPMVWAVLDESVLLRPMGGPEVLREQLGHLLALLELPNVVIQVVPMAVGAYPGYAGGFLILSTDQGEVAYAEAHLGGRLIEDTAEVENLEVRFDLIRAQALSVDSSAELIRSVMEDLT
jgi:transcriptional regulator with XRE-family HTH domain